MARRRVGTGSTDQMAFDFAFNETAETIERLQANNDEGAAHADNIDAATGPRSQDLDAGDAGGGSALSVVPPSGMEDPGSLGSQQSAKAEGLGGAGGGDFAGPPPAAARDRAPGPDRGVEPAVERDGGARDPRSTRDRDGAVRPRDYAITAGDRLGEGGPKAKFRDNINAIRVLHQLRQAGDAATPEQQALLVRYVGWGGLPQAFDHRNDEWHDEYLELSGLLDREDYERARRSTQDAHYTSGVV